MSARTVTVGRRLRCQMMPSSKPYSSVGDLRQRHAAPFGVGTARLPSRARRARSSSGAAQQDLDQLVAFAVGADAQARTASSCRNCDSVRGAHAQRARAVLVDLQAHDLARLVPVEVDVGDVADWRAPSPRPAARQRAHAVDVLAGDAELDRIADRRAVLQARHAQLQRRELRRRRRRSASCARLRAPPIVVRSRTNCAKLACGSCWSSGR